ncbi:hypothetical protein BGZ47_004524, partial [Haplosporangium gracile]
MADNRLNLFCLIDGEPQLYVFSAKATPTDTVDDLRVFISARPEIGALSKDLALWRVSIPIVDDNDELPILLDNVADKDKKKLDPTDDVSEVFPSRDKLPKKTIHVIIRQPPP